MSRMSLLPPPTTGGTTLHHACLSSQQAAAIPEPTQRHVVVVGAGVSGLACAHQLLKQQHQQQASPNGRSSPLQITLVEASARIGGRVWSGSGNGISSTAGDGKEKDDSECFKYDYGAEFIHGRGTVLTELLEELGLAGQDGCWQDFWISSHADGGPTSTSITPAACNADTTTTNNEQCSNNCYGRYYIDGQLREASDPTVQALTDTLEEIMSPSSATKEESFGEALSRRKGGLTQNQQQQLEALAVASFGNTAGCTDLYQLSLPVLRHFHKHWEECEEAGDYQWRRPAMMGEWVDRWVERLLMWNSNSANGSDNNTEKDAATSSTTNTNNNKIRIHCDWPVQTIQKFNDDDSQTSYRLVSQDGAVLHADWVVVTVPPCHWPEILGDLLTARKRTALPYIGFSRVVKVVCFFSQRLWPEGLQSLIVAADRRSDRDSSLHIPEFWFREDAVTASQQGHTTTTAGVATATASTVPSQTQYIMVGYLTSHMADDFVAKIQQIQQADSGNHGRLSREDVAATMVVKQLAHMFPWNSHADCRAALRHILVLDWRDDAPHIRGGYMHPIRGMTVQHLKDLSAREQRLLFAGEATNTNACCTLQAAMETGVRAAGEIWEDLQAIRSSQEWRGDD